MPVPHILEIWSHVHKRIPMNYYCGSDCTVAICTAKRYESPRCALIHILDYNHTHKHGIVQPWMVIGFQQCYWYLYIKHKTYRDLDFSALWDNHVYQDVRTSMPSEGFVQFSLIWRPIYCGITKLHLHHVSQKDQLMKKWTSWWYLMNLARA